MSPCMRRLEGQRCGEHLFESHEGGSEGLGALDSDAARADTEGLELGAVLEGRGEGDGTLVAKLIERHVEGSELPPSVLEHAREQNHRAAAQVLLREVLRESLSPSSQPQL